MLWFYLALASAFFSATSDGLSKKAFARGDEYVVGWMRLFLAAPVLALLLPFAGGIPRLDATFYLTVVIMVPLEITALLLYLKAIRSDLTLISYLATSFGIKGGNFSYHLYFGAFHRVRNRFVILYQDNDL